MKSIEDPGDSDYGSRVLVSFRNRGLATQWSQGTIKAIETASRLEFLALFKRYDTFHSYGLIELIRTGTPEAFVDRLLREKQARDLAAMIPMMFISAF